MSLSILMCNFLFIYSKVKMYNGFRSKLICALLSQGAGEGEEGIAPLYRYSSIVLVCVYIYIYIDRYTYNFQTSYCIEFPKKGLKKKPNKEKRKRIRLIKYNETFPILLFLINIYSNIKSFSSLVLIKNALLYIYIFFLIFNLAR